MVPTNFPFFSYSPEDEQIDKPNVWLRCYKLLWDSKATEKEKINTFRLVLEPDSPAGTVVGHARRSEEDNMARCETGVQETMPTLRALEMSTETRQANMLALKVMDNEVGKIMTEGKRTEFTHVIWVDKVEAH